jgi:hypothetical protein
MTNPVTPEQQLEDVLLEDRVERGTATPEDLERYADRLLAAPPPLPPRPPHTPPAEHPRPVFAPRTLQLGPGVRARTVENVPLSERNPHDLLDEPDAARLFHSEQSRGMAPGTRRRQPAQASK